MLRIAIATFVACAPLIASAQQGVVRVLGATKKATGTAWFINREDGIFMTAAHVVLASVANPATDAIVLEACHDLPRTDNIPERRLRVSMHAALQCWGGPPLADQQQVKTWHASLQDRPTRSDWAVLRVDTSDASVQAVLEFLEPINLNAFIGDADVTPCEFVAYGFPDNSFVSKDYDGRLKPSGLGSGLYRMSFPSDGGNSGGPVVVKYGTGRLLPMTACGLVTNRDGPDYSIVIALHDVLADIADRAPVGVTTQKVLDMVARTKPLTDVEYYSALAACRALAGYGHIQVQRHITPASHQVLWEFLKVYYSRFGNVGFVSGMASRNPPATLVAREAVRAAVRSVNEATAAFSAFDAVDGLIVSDIAEEALIAGEAVGPESDNARRFAVGDTLSAAVIILDRVSTRSPQSMALRRRAALMAHDLGTSDKRQLALALSVASVDDRSPRLSDPDLATFVAMMANAVERVDEQSVAAKATNGTLEQYALTRYGKKVSDSGAITFSFAGRVVPKVATDGQPEAAAVDALTQRLKEDVRKRRAMTAPF